MRIWAQCPISFPEEMREAAGPVRKAYGEVAGRACRPDTEVEVRFPEEGLRDTDIFFWHYPYFLHHAPIMEGLLQSEREGYDAAAILCFYDPCLDHAREMLNIPVAAPCESSLLLARLMGKTCGIVTVGGGKMARHVEDNVRRYGGERHCVGVESCSESGSDILRMLLILGGSGDDPQPLIDVYLASARRLIARGAEVVITGCAAYAPFLTAQGITEVDGVPVIDCVAAEMKVLEVLAALKEAGLPWISRAASYRQPPPELVEYARETYTGRFVASE